MTQPTLINLRPNEYTSGLLYYSFAVSLDRFVGSCNNLDDWCNRVCVPNTQLDLNAQADLNLNFLI